MDADGEKKFGGGAGGWERSFEQTPRNSHLADCRIVYARGCLELNHEWPQPRCKKRAKDHLSPALSPRGGEGDGGVGRVGKPVLFGALELFEPPGPSSMVG